MIMNYISFESPFSLAKGQSFSQSPISRTLVFPDEFLKKKYFTSSSDSLARLTVGGGTLGLLETCLKESAGGWLFFDPAPSIGENGDVCKGSKTLPCEGNKPCLSNGGSPVLNMWPRKKEKEIFSRFIHAKSYHLKDAPFHRKQVNMSEHV